MALVAASITAAASSMATEAGRHAWASLGRLVRRAFGDRAPAVLPEQAPAQPDPEWVQDLARKLVDYAAGDERFAADLRSWAVDSRVPATAVGDAVINTISGGATVHGTVIQGRDFTGSIHFGSSASADER